MSSMARGNQLQAEGEGEDGASGEGAPFRNRSQSAPPALWAAKKYGRQLRRMSDEFDILLDKGVRRGRWRRSISHRLVGITVCASRDHECAVLSGSPTR